MTDATGGSISGAVTFDAVVLAGGRARRMDGVDKAMLSVGGRPLLWHALDAVESAGTVVIVGPRRPVTRDDVVWAREEPPHGGPVAALATGLDHTATDLVVVLGGDTLVRAEIVRTLVEHLAASDHSETRLDAVLPRVDGTPQPLAAAYRADALRAAIGRLGDPSGHAMHELVAELTVDHRDTGAIGDANSPEVLARLRAHQDDVPVVLDEWYERLAEALGIDPASDPMDLVALLDLSRAAAHRVARPAAPVTALLAGYAAARAGGGPAAIDEAFRVARELTARWEPEGS